MSALERHGLFWGLLAVASFSLTLPATRVAVGSLGVGFVSVGRGIGAGLAAAAILWTTRQPVPGRRDLLVLIAVAACVVIGFPFLTSLAMTQVSASHGAVVVGLLPLSTAVAGAAFAGERSSHGFWLASLAGTVVLLAFVLSDTRLAVAPADIELMGAVIFGACGYALGGRLAVRLGGWQVICWALVVSLPLLFAAAPLLVDWPRNPVPLAAWVGFGYLALVSQLIGFFAWYRGLAMGGIARVSQMQSLQLFMTLAASAALLGERIEPRVLAYGAAMTAIVAVGARLRVDRNSSAMANAPPGVAP